MPVPDVAVPAEPPTESPTGKPLIPPVAVPWIAGAVGVAAALAKALPDHTIVDKVCVEIVTWGSFLLALGPGLRHHAAKAVALLMAVGLTLSPAALAEAPSPAVVAQIESCEIKAARVRDRREAYWACVRRHGNDRCQSERIAHEDAERDWQAFCGPRG